MLQEPEATVKEFMTANPILTEIEAQIRYYQVQSQYFNSQLFCHH
jgi:hypothetical protein